MRTLKSLAMCVCVCLYVQMRVCVEHSETPNERSSESLKLYIVLGCASAQLKMFWDAFTDFKSFTIMLVYTHRSHDRRSIFYPHYFIQSSMLSHDFPDIPCTVQQCIGLLHDVART